MKVHFGFILLLTVLQQCTTAKTSSNLDANITYTAYSRGFFKEVHVRQNQFAVIEKRGAGLQWKSLSAEAKKNVFEALKGINMNKISTLEAPTNKRFHDGAAIAQLKVETKTDTFESAAFDHGNPPQEIATLVEQLLKLESKP
ncbi:hypothetical protein [Flavobacterium sp.]|uniref:hypothetical protein n=1 Tax=Flavobacterium sp. TaxID=239 RepID=UPI003B995B97